MGNYNLKSSILRCQNCFSIRKMTINPGFPQTFVNSECKCDVSNIPLKQFLEELGKGIHFKIICKICKKEDKNSSYCHNCNHIYCPSCLKDHKKHKYISISKVDYYCIFHQKDLFCSYCYECSMNICKKCICENKHLNHNCKEFSKLMMNKNERNFLKEKFRLAESKLDFGTQFVNAFVKKLKKEDNKNIILNAEKNNLAQNKNILELIKFFIYFYDNSKYKNYNIIYNFTANINLNVNKFKFSENNISLDEAYEEILKFLKEDFIIIRNEKMNYEKKNSKQTKALWDFDDNEIETRQTVIGTMAFEKFGLKLNENGEKNELNSYNEKMHKNSSRLKLLNSVSEENKREENRKNVINKIEKIKKPDLDENTYNRPRSHAIFIPTKLINKQMQETNQEGLKEVKHDENKIEPININQEKGEKSEKEQRNEKEKLEILENENKIKEEEKLDEKIEKKEAEQKTKKNEEKVQVNKEKISLTKKQNRIKKNNIFKKENKYEYAKFIGINRYKSKTRSIINKMMINGYKNSKVYTINPILFKREF